LENITDHRLVIPQQFTHMLLFRNISSHRAACGKVMDDYASFIQAGDRQDLLLIGLIEKFQITLAHGVVIPDLIHLCQSA